MLTMYPDSSNGRFEKNCGVIIPHGKQSDGSRAMTVAEIVSSVGGTRCFHFPRMSHKEKLMATTSEIVG